MTAARDLCFAVIVLMLLLAGTASLAQTAPAGAGSAYPVKPIRVIASGAGSANDILARIVGTGLSRRLRQPVIVDNRAGASGTIGAELTAKAPPDGYTLLLGFNGNLAAIHALRKQLPYDAIKDFEPVTLAASIAGALVVHPSIPVRSVGELIRFAANRPGQLNFATYGVGSGSHMAGELFKSMAGIDITSVSYKSSTQAVNDVVAGHVHLMIHSAPVVLPLARAGKLRALAVTSAKRSSTAPELPTLSEAGLPGYELTIWFGFLAPAGTPLPVVELLNREIVAVLNEPPVRESLNTQGYDIVGSTPGEFGSYLRAEIARYAKIVKDANIAVE